MPFHQRAGCHFSRRRTLFHQRAGRHLDRETGCYFSGNAGCLKIRTFHEKEKFIKSQNMGACGILRPLRL